MSLPRFAPNLHHQFLELPPRERFAAARLAGFDAVEWHFPYEVPKAELKALLDDNGLAFTYCVCPVDWSRDLGLAGQPGREDEFRRSAEIGLDYAAHIRSRAMQIGPGTVPAGVERARCVDTFVANLAWFCRQAAGTGIAPNIEGVCQARFPNFVIQTIGEAEAVRAAVVDPSLRIVFDTYHLRMQETGPLAALLDRHASAIGHVQIGNAPLRHEPGVGEIDLHDVIARVHAMGYPGWIGLEYDPSADTWTSLAWMGRYGYPPATR